MKSWVWVGDDDGCVILSVFPGESGGADLYLSPDTAEDIAKRLEDVARRVRRAFLFTGESGNDCDQ